jgi:UDP-2-acetamido-2,6-beta-L-arabino-hexul-4-ose reductase
VNIVVTGADGFIAKNLLIHLVQYPEWKVKALNRHSGIEDWKQSLHRADTVVHLAGVNRPADISEFGKVNSELTEFIVDELEKKGDPYRILFSSSIQALQDNPYGESKRKAEKYIQTHVKNGQYYIYRLPGIFGKWCKPNYNSVVATFCNNIAQGKEIEISDRNKTVQLMYIDDACNLFIDAISGSSREGLQQINPDLLYNIKLGELADTIQSFPLSRQNLFLPVVGEALVKKLYSTYLTYLPTDHFNYSLTLRTDNRGSLFELFKSLNSGQIFISYTKPGITRGNHFHHTKTEKFCVLSGEGLIRFRKINDDGIIEYRVSGNSPQVVDIPPGYTHNITNVGETEMITLFWANEVFDPNKPDTIFLEV